MTWERDVRAGLQEEEPALLGPLLCASQPQGGQANLASLTQPLDVTCSCLITENILL